MVRLHVKKGDESQFLFETNLSEEVNHLIEMLTNIYNGRLKVTRVCYEMEELMKYGTALPPDMQGLTDEQIEELNLKDDWGVKCEPPDGWTFNKDPIGKRNGKQPSARMGEVLNKSMLEAKALISKKLIEADACLTLKMVSSALDILRGAVMIAYPMGLPPHDPIRMEFDNAEDLAGTQASLEVLEVQRTALWFCGKEMKRGKTLADFLGKNEKTKVIVKLQKSGQGPPSREPIMSEAEHKAVMMQAYRRQEQLKKLDEDTDNDYLNSKWADGSGLKKSMHGLGNVSWRP